MRKEGTGFIKSSHFAAFCFHFIKENTSRVVHSMGSPQYSFPFLIPFSVNSPWWAAFSNKEARSDKQIMPFSASNPEWTGDTKKVATPLPQPKKPPRQSRQLFGDFCTVASDGGGGTDDATSGGGGGGTDGGGQKGDKAQEAGWARLADVWPFKKGAGIINS